MFATLVTLTVAAFFLTGMAFAMHAAASARTPQGAVGWVVFLLTMPFLAVPAYLFLGHHRFRGYRIARLESAQVVQGISAFAALNAPEPGACAINLAPFEKIARLPATTGNGVDLLINGHATFDAIVAAIDGARDYVLIQFYIVRDDTLGQRIQRHLIAAARRGVRVWFMTDAIGSLSLPAAYGDKLRAAGVRVVDRYNARGPRFRFQINYRNHRKTVVVDGKTGFIGGLNVGDEYMGLDPDYLGSEAEFGDWRDTHLQLRGPIVLQLQLIFVEDWYWAAEEPLLQDLRWETPNAPENATALIVATGPGDSTETGSLMFFSAITAARKRLWIASPYFIPDIDVMTALKHAALRGVDVRLLVPEMADNHMPWLAAFAYFDDIRESGVRVFRYTSGFMHQKVFLVDDDLIGVGTTNLDNRSFRLNFEAMALFFDADAAAEVAEMLSADFARSYEMSLTIDQQRAFIRYGAPVARLFAPLL